MVFCFLNFHQQGKISIFTVELSGSFEELLERIKEYHDNFDIDYETYIWLDSDGHGKMGAPYHIKDLVEDMEACLHMILELYNLLKKAYDED